MFGPGQKFRRHVELTGLGPFLQLYPRVATIVGLATRVQQEQHNPSTVGSISITLQLHTSGITSNDAHCKALKLETLQPTLNPMEHSASIWVQPKNCQLIN